MSKRVPISNATKSWQMLDKEYPGLMEKLENMPELTSSEALSHEHINIVFEVSKMMGKKCGEPLEPYGMAAVDRALTRFIDLALIDARFFMPYEYAWMARWRACKHVYRIDNAVARELERTPISGKIPVDVLRKIPYPIVYIDHPCEVSQGTLDAPGTVPAVGFFAYIDADVYGDESLAICYVMPDGRRVPLLFNIAKCETLDELAEEAMSEDRTRQYSGASYNTSAAQAWIFKNCVAQALSLLLYVVSEENDPEVIYAPPKRRSGERQPRRQNPETITLLGAHIGRKLGIARKSSDAHSGGAHTGKTVAPHIRRAHWAHYWIGQRKGRTDGKFGDELIVKWISPVAVNGSSEASETVHEG